MPGLKFAVQSGAKLLDRAMPGWASKIDTDLKTFRMSDKGKCILPQLFDTFERGLAVLKIQPEQADLYGFDAQRNDPVQHFELRSLWIGEINARVGATRNKSTLLA